jgi:hypothetical protein
MNRPIIRRPKTLKEVAVEGDTYQDFGMNLKDFLHEFTWAKEKKLPLLPFLEEEPPLLADRFNEGRSVMLFWQGRPIIYLERIP